MKTKENKSSVAVIEQPEQGDKEALEYFRQQVVELTKATFGVESSTIFAAGVLAGIALGKKRLVDAFDSVFPYDPRTENSEMSPDEDNRHTLATMRLSDVVSDWPVESIEVLSNLLETTSLKDVVQKIS